VLGLDVANDRLDGGAVAHLDCRYPVVLDPNGEMGSGAAVVEPFLFIGGKLTGWFQARPRNPRNISVL
jgi:hypothetical protein